MSKLVQPNHNYKLAIEDCVIDEEKEEVQCLCFTPGMSFKQEPESFQKIVSFQELHNKVCDRDNLVDLTKINKPDDEIQITFYQWIQEVDSFELAYFCATIINKRENRTTYYPKPTDRTAELIDGIIRTATQAENSLSKILASHAGQSTAQMMHGLFTPKQKSA